MRANIAIENDFLAYPPPPPPSPTPPPPHPQGFQTPQGIGASAVIASAALPAACAVLGCGTAQLQTVLTERVIATGLERVVKPLKVRGEGDEG